MSKKRGKSSSAAGQSRWEAGLMAAAFEEDNWRVNIQFVVENDLLDETHIKALANVVKIPQRRLFSYLHKDDLMAMVNELGNPKNKKPPKIPQFYEITEIIFGLLNAEQEIPLPLWAKLIKFGLINIKDNDLRRRDTEAKSKEEKEKGKGSAKKRPRSKSPGKGKGKKTPEPTMPKKDWSTLKKRGEEDDDNKYIDDEPDDGPEHYIFISGFRKPQLLPILCELGININGVIRISSESYDQLTAIEENKRAGAEMEADALAVAQSKKEVESKELLLFWKLLPVVLQRLPPTSKLQDFARLEFVVQNTMYPSDWEDADNMIGYGTTLFEDIACKVYDSLDWQRQYLHYLKNVNLIHVPKFGEPEPASVETPPEPRNTPSAGGKRDKTKPTLEPPGTTEEIVPPITPPTSVDVDSRYYRDLLDSVPMDSISVPLIMHCMLEQVVATEEGKTPPSEKDPEPRTDGIHLALADCIADALDGLCLSDDDMQLLSTDFPMLKQRSDKEIEQKKVPEGPILLHYGDESTVRTHHLKEFDGFHPRIAEEELLKRVPSARLLSKPAVSDQTTNERAARLHELLRHASSTESSDDVISAHDVDRVFRQFVFESMDLSCVDVAGDISYVGDADNPGNLWDDPYTLVTQKLKQQLQSNTDEEKGSLEASEKTIAADDKVLSFKRTLDGYSYTEHFEPKVLLQILEEARQTYPCMDTYVHKRDNSLFVTFHHPVSDNLTASTKWSTSLHSDVGFRNYLEYVAGSIQAWTDKEETLYQGHLLTLEMERSQQVPQSASDVTTPPATAKRPRSKSPKKSSRRGSASRASSKAGLSDEQQFSSPFIRAGSLKAETEIQNKLKEEEERIRKEKESKQSSRNKSAERGKNTKSAASKTSQDGKGKRPKSGRRSKSRSRSRSNSREREVVPTPQVESKEEPALPFLGYDVGNNLINITGKTSYLCPCDGGTIKSETMAYEQGKVFVKTTMYKDGHTFVLHITDPRDSEAERDLDQLIMDTTKASTEKSETESQEKDGESAKDTARPTSAELLAGMKEESEECHCLFSSWCATLCDGMTLALSKHGADGICKAATKANEKLLKLLGEIPPASSPTPVPPGMDTPQKKGGKKSPRSKSPRGKSPKGKKKGAEAEKDAEAQRLEELRAQEELERKLLEAQEAEEQARKREKLPKFQQLYISTPDGLALRYQIDPTSADTTHEDEVPQFKLMVRQSYPYKTAGRQEAERARSKPAMEEMSRTILSDGTVIKLLKDGSTKILYGNGTVCDNAGSGPISSEQKTAVTPHSLPSAVSQPAAVLPEDQRTATSAGSKKGSRGRKSSGKTNTEAPTDPSLAGTTAGQGAAHLEAEAGAKSEAELERAGSWKTSFMSGEVAITKLNGTVLQQPPLMCYTATDPVTGEVMLSREDKVIHVMRRDGSYVCDHTDGTRITRYYKDVQPSGEAEEQAETGDSPVCFIQVECLGFATVVFNQKDQSCVTVFGGGTSLVTELDGTYHLSHWNGGQLDIVHDGSMLYTPRPDNDQFITGLSGVEGSYEGEEAPSSQPPVGYGSYVMRQNAQVCCEAVDQEGNVFQVKMNGEVSVINPDPIHGGGEQGTNDDMKLKVDPLEHHPPRLFVIHEDGSGSELLRSKDVQMYIGDAHIDPTSSVIREPLPEDGNVLGITVLRPHFGNSSNAWLLELDEGDIVPRNVKTRDLTQFPPKEVKKPGPLFATTTGKGLAVGSAPHPFQPPITPPCPSALELRQLVQYQPVSKELRSILKKRMLEFGRMRLQHEMERERLMVHDPRSDEEKMRASDLLSIVLDLDENATPRQPAVAPHPAGAGEAPKTPICVAHSKATAVVPDEQQSSVVKLKYEASVAPPPPPVIPPPREKLTQADWDMLRRGIEEEQAGWLALKNHDVPSYFDSPIGHAWLMTQANDVKTMNLSRDPRKDGSEARMSEDRGRSTSSSSPLPEKSQHSTPTIGNSAPGLVSDTPSKMRPTNPTPAHASGKGTPTGVRPDNPTPFAAAQLRNMRPSNPTPIHASNKQVEQTSNQLHQPSPIPENPTSAQRREDRMTPTDGNDHSPSSGGSQPHPILLDREETDLVLTRSLLYDASGQRRKDRVNLPTSIMSDKPGCVPNTKFITVEEPVRRKVKTSSVSGGLVQGHHKVAERGFQLLPPEVVFGILREGSTYSYTVRMRNTGIDLCRFRIKQPPPGTGMRINYSPGPVAAGMETKIEIEVYAIAVGVEGDSGVGTINHHLEIITETDIMLLPITAIVLTAHDYDNRRESLPQGGTAPGVILSSSKPPSRSGILRAVKMES